MWRRGTHRHVKITAEPQIEKPSRSIALRDRLASPWLVVGQYIFNLIIVLFVLWLTGNQAEMQRSQVEVTDYLNGTGDQRDAERDAAEKDRQARSDATHQVLCDLINALEADIGRELSGMRSAAACAASPFQPGAMPASPGSLPDETSQLGPIVPGAGTSSGSATPGSELATGDRSGGAGGRESSPDTGGNGGGEGTPDASEPDEEAPPPPADGDGGGLIDGIDLCAPLLGCLL